jgi:4-aminobutyrate aminotransferase-like enzyme
MAGREESRADRRAFLMSDYIFTREPQVVAKVDTEHREIVTGIPGPSTKAILDKLDGLEALAMRYQLPIVWDNAYDYQVEDLDGNLFIDFTSGIFVANVGHGNTEVECAVQDQFERSMTYSYTYATKVRANYLEALTAWSGFDKALLLSSGTEAVEAAMKYMRVYGRAAGKTRPGIISIAGAYHGRTMGAQLLNGGKHAQWIGNDDPNIWRMNFVGASCETPEEFFEHDLVRIAGINGLNATKDICGFMLETFTGWNAGFYHERWVKAVERYCRKHDILLCFDEMQAGFGRTGKKFGYEYYGVKPDMICVGKAMGNGLPLSGVLGRRDILDLKDAHNLTSTHSANPLCCAAGWAVLRELEVHNLVAEAERKGDILFDRLGKMQKAGLVEWARGAGLIAAIGFKLSEQASVVAEKCMQRGLIVVHTGRESIKIGPPLTIVDEALIEGLDVLESALK